MWQFLLDIWMRYTFTSITMLPLNFVKILETFQLKGNTLSEADPFISSKVEFQLNSFSMTFHMKSSMHYLDNIKFLCSILSALKIIPLNKMYCARRI